MVFNCFYRNKTQFFNKCSYNFNSKLYFLKTFNTCGSDGKESTCNAGELGSIPGLGRSPGEGKGYPLQYSGLENSMDYIVHGVTKSSTQLSDFPKHRHFDIKPSFSSRPTQPSRCWPCFSYQPVSFLPEPPSSTLLSPTESLRWEETDQ